MTYADERVAAEMGRVLMAIYRAGLEVKLWPEGMSGRAGARIVSGPAARTGRGCAPRSASGSGDSPLAAIYAAVQRMNHRAGALLVRVDD